jgi:hypothetical protein
LVRSDGRQAVGARDEPPVVGEAAAHAGRVAAWQLGEQDVVDRGDERRVGRAQERVIREVEDVASSDEAVGADAEPREHLGGARGQPRRVHARAGRRSRDAGLGRRRWPYSARLSSGNLGA